MQQMEALEPLRLFVHLSRTLHFARTAEACHVSPSALSRTIQRLEHETGATLFARDRRTVELTTEGRRLRAFALDVLASWERAEHDLRGTGDLRGALSIFCTVTASQSLLPDMLLRFRDAHPDVQIRVETGYAADALARLESGVDATIAALPPRLPRSVCAHSLVTTPLVFVAPAGAGAVSRAVDDRPVRWGEVPMVVPPMGLARDAVDAWFRRRGVTPQVYSEIASHEAILSLVSLGCGVGIVPELVLEKSALRERVRALDVRPRPGVFDVGVCALRRKLRSPLLAAFWDTVVRYGRGPSRRAG
jgi:LysR family positive regulator for ilvC